MLKEASRKRNFGEMTLSQLVDVVLKTGPALARNDLVVSTIIDSVEKRMVKELKNNRLTSEFPVGVQDDRTAFAIALLHTARRSLAEYNVSDATLKTLFQVLMKDLFIEKTYIEASESFYTEYGLRPPTFLLISPGKGCNIHCKGCYADAGHSSEKLSFDTVDRCITQMYELWGSRFVVISGGEPTVWRSEGRDILDVAAAHPECLFLMYTNGTLIDDAMAKRMSDIGNLLPAISVEGWRERTDGRRGKGVFDAILAAMDRLNGNGTPFGISLTGTNQNYREILSDDFLDYFFFEKHALFSWLFQYHPIGRSYTLGLMPSPEQRLWMWRRSWQVVREKKVFLADFWNSATITKGCLSAGGHNNGGYLYIDWNGNVSPCVFLPYSPVNIHKVFAGGGNLNDIWDQPFFSSIRKWQGKQQQDNIMLPCPYRDHYKDLREMILTHEVDPMDENAREALLDEGYIDGMVAYDRQYQALTQPIWEQYYCRERKTADGKLGDLPDLELSMDIDIAQTV